MPRNHRTRQRKGDLERDARRAERRKELLEAADAVLRKDGPGASMTDIAAAAGVTKPILYKHFGDKGGLYQALAERYLRQLLDLLRTSLTGSGDPKAPIAPIGDLEDARLRLKDTIDTYLSFIEREKEVYAFLMHRAVGERPEAQATVADFIRQLGDEIAIILGEELRRNGVDSGAAEPWAHGMVGMVYLAGDRWLDRPTMPRARLVEYLTALLWNGFSSLPADAHSPAAEVS
ncbi:MAG: TetR/AcrR family transcriptional regulator [Actinomycetota bacterium]|nr:TetR/AcrR family transcriptional regulator [Actinomycetota bacterium]